MLAQIAMPKKQGRSVLYTYSIFIRIPPIEDNANLRFKSKPNVARPAQFSDRPPSIQLFSIIELVSKVVTVHQYGTKVVR
jgi:hypothetical protein